MAILGKTWLVGTCSALALLSGCGGDSGGDSAGASQVGASGSGAEVASVAASGNKDVGACLLDAVKSPCAVLSVDTVRGAFPEVSAAISQKEDVSKYSSTCTLNWTGGRKTTFATAAMSMEVEVDDSVVVSNIREMSAEQFAFQHRTLSEEEKANAAAKVEASIDKSVDDGKLADEHKEMGKEFAKTLLNKVEWQAVSGLGDLASWGGIGKFKNLDVLVGGTQFSVRAEMANEEDAVRDASVKVAQAIIAGCDS